MGRTRKNKRPEYISGGYATIPWAVLDSQSFIGASDKAKALLFALMRQHNGENNGHLHLTKKWLYEKGWTCHENNSKSRNELIARGLIEQTKWGGLNAGADLFALTWHKISNYVGLQIEPRGYRLSAYTLCDLPPTKRRKPPQKRNGLPSNRDSTVPTIVTDDSLTDTTTVSKMIRFSKYSGTTIENKVVIPFPPFKSLKRIVGVKGRSGIPRNNSPQLAQV